MSPICTGGGGIAKPLANKWQKERNNLARLHATLGNSMNAPPRSHGYHNIPRQGTGSTIFTN